MAEQDYNPLNIHDHYKKMLERNLSLQEAAEIGLGHWERQRACWTIGHHPYKSTVHDYNSHPALKDVNESHFDAIYNSLVSGRRFTQPVPLSFVVKILVNIMSSLVHSIKFQLGSWMEE